MIAIPVYVREEKNYELLEKCVNSCPTPPDGFINAFDLEDEKLYELFGKTRFVERDVNSVAGAWNDAIAMSDRLMDSYCVIANQDIIFPDITDLKNAAIRHGIAAAKTKQGEPDFALFAVNPEFIKEKFGTLRPFDEGFEGAYFEDNDFRYQCKLKGINIELVDLDFEHYGSGVLKHDEEAAKENEQRFRKNHIRYINKWGGIRNFETFKTPFNK